ncbi:hypothetical protein BaRGS_00021665 [Batillaria attramentaria]|uniref:Uncharacterized protein n=1 Tax=Batillaria attramentaria TaxID=370345 RepID=A0ABD0KJ00_9CAEN
MYHTWPECTTGNVALLVTESHYVPYMARVYNRQRRTVDDGKSLCRYHTWPECTTGNVALLTTESHYVPHMARVYDRQRRTVDDGKSLCTTHGQSVRQATSHCWRRKVTMYHTWPQCTTGNVALLATESHYVPYMARVYNRQRRTVDDGKSLCRYHTWPECTTGNVTLLATESHYVPHMARVYDRQRRTVDDGKSLCTTHGQSVRQATSHCW